MFKNQKTLAVARNLIGKILVRRVGKRLIREIITETEAYVGPHDLACHSSRGRTKRNEPMYDEAGTIYVYFTYGMHWMLNIVTEETGFGAAVLIRATENFKGPGRLTKALKIDGSLNAKKLGKKSGLWIESEDNKANQAKKLIRTPRIGISYSGPIWSKKLYRFVLRD